MSEQVVIDSLEFALNHQSLSGMVAVAELSRLVDALYSDQGALEYTLSGGVNQLGKPVLHCRVKGKLQLQCQRCLEGMEYVLDIRSELMLAQDEAALLQLDEQDEEATDAILADTKLNVLSLVEDEVLLDLPLAPRHSTGACQVKAAELSSPELSPFAVLAKLKPERGDK